MTDPLVLPELLVSCTHAQSQLQHALGPDALTGLQFL